MVEVDLKVLDLVRLFGNGDAESFKLGGVVEVGNLGFNKEAEFVGYGFFHKELVRSEAYNVCEVHQGTDVNIVGLAGEETVNSLFGGVKFGTFCHLLGREA